MLDLTGGKYGPWIVTDKGDQTVRALVDEHYSRQSVGASQFCRPGHNLVLRTVDGSAAWISWRGIRDDGIERAWECTFFRNTSTMLSSELIHWAVYATISEWRHVFPANGFITYVDPKKVSSEVPGYCFIRAGFKKVGVSKRRKLILFHLPITKRYLTKLQSMILDGRLSGWKDYLPHLNLWELEDITSSFDGLEEMIENLGIQGECV